MKECTPLYLRILSLAMPYTFPIWDKKSQDTTLDTFLIPQWIKIQGIFQGVRENKVSFVTLTVISNITGGPTILYDCESCNSRQPLLASAVMENSELPYIYWLGAIYPKGTSKKVVSAPYIYRLLGHKGYEFIWYMMQKVRMLMGK